MVKGQERANAAAHWTACEARLQKAKKVVHSLGVMPARKGFVPVAPNEAALLKARAEVKVAALAVTEAAEAFHRACRA